MSKTRLLAITLLVSLLLPFGLVAAQEEPTTIDDAVLYEALDELTAEDDSTLEYPSYDDVSMEEWSDDTVIYDPIAAQAAFATTIIVVLISSVVGLAGYIFTALALSKIGKEMGYENPWFAWIPVLNTVMMFQLGEQNPWLLLAVLIPGVGAVVITIVMIIALMNITEKRGYEKILAILILVPFGMFVLLYLLAWKPKNGVTQQVTETVPQATPVV